MTLEDLVEKSILVLRETKSQFENPVILWSTGKDSTLTVSLCRDAFFGEVPFPVLHIDTGWEFPTMHEFRDRLAKEWNLDLIVKKSDKAGVVKPNEKMTHQECCQVLKTDVFRETIEKHCFDAVIVSMRGDEQHSRNMDSPVESGQNELQDASQKDSGNCHLINRYPILHWNEIDVWRYSEERNLPVNPLYFSKKGKRYQSVGCYPCVAPIKSKADTSKKIIKEIRTTKTEEKSGIAQDKEAKEIMERLKALGYM